MGTAFLDLGRCLPWGMETPCIVCEEMCPTSPKAIWLDTVEGTRRDGTKVVLQQPHVDPELCTGCGLCENRCPVGEQAAIGSRPSVSPAIRGTGCFSAKPPEVTATRPPQCYSRCMRFEQRLAAWSVTGFLQQALFVGAGASAALALVAAAFIAFGSLAIRAVLPAIDRHVEQGWVDALGPLSTLSERYPTLQKNAAARQVEVFAAALGISLASENDTAAPIPNPQQLTAFSRVRASLLADPGEPGGNPNDSSARDAWMGRNSSTINDLAETVINGEVPVWAMDLDDCVGSFSVRLDGLVDLQSAILASAQWSIDAGDLDRGTRLLEASWRLNDTLQRNPRLEEHLASITVVDHQMAVLRRHPDPGGHWKVRLAALDLEQRALETVRLDAWLLRCRAAAVLNHPVLGVFAQPFARLLAIQQHQAMVWAVEELPARDVTRFEPDRFVAEQHRRIPRWNTIARCGPAGRLAILARQRPRLAGCGARPADPGAAGCDPKLESLQPLRFGTPAAVPGSRSRMVLHLRSRHRVHRPRRRRLAQRSSRAAQGNGVVALGCPARR